jgi:hypothetical protein
MTPLIELTKLYYRLGAIDKCYLFRKIYGSPIENIRKIQNYSFIRSLNYYFLSMHVNGIKVAICGKVVRMTIARIAATGDGQIPRKIVAMGASGAAAFNTKTFRPTRWRDLFSSCKEDSAEKDSATEYRSQATTPPLLPKSRVQPLA